MPTLPARSPQRSTPYYLLEMLGYWLYWRSRPLLDARSLDALLRSSNEVQRTLDCMAVARG